MKEVTGKPNGQPEPVHDKGKGRKGAAILQFGLDKYKPEEWIIPASDTKGHNVRYYFRAPEGYIRQINLIVTSHKFPLRTPGEVIRLALKKLFEALENMEPAVPSIMSQVRAVEEIIKEENYHQGFVDMIDAVHNTVQRQVNNGEEDRARLTLAKAQASFLEMNRNTESGRYWRKKYLKELQTRWPSLVVPVAKEELEEVPVEVQVQEPVKAQVYRLRIEREEV